MSNTEIELMPYLQFQGNCEEALLFIRIYWMVGLKSHHAMIILR